VLPPAGERLMTRNLPSQRGVALVLTLIFAILLYVLIAELVVSGRMVRLTGENDALLARMRNHMDYTLFEVQEQLLEDMAGAAASEESASGAGAMPTGGLPTGGVTTTLRMPLEAPASSTMPSMWLMTAGSFGWRASKSSTTRRRPPTCSGRQNARS